MATNATATMTAPTQNEGDLVKTDKYGPAAPPAAPFSNLHQPPLVSFPTTLVEFTRLWSNFPEAERVLSWFPPKIRREDATARRQAAASRTVAATNVGAERGTKE
jgi:hypothetical protein